jgi:enoyl-CoA hydratase/3-hydroxyacyl-CoA dehydrogenase
MKIQKVGIIGAGTMGSGIAQKIAQAGIPVVMIDVKDKYVQNGLAIIEKTLEEAVKRGIFTSDQTQSILKNIHITTNKDAVKDADIVIEVVYEDIKVKQDLFTYLDTICKDTTILATNTSSFSITELASSLKNSDRFIGLHFFYHPAKNRLLEIIPSNHTNETSINTATLFSKMIGKTAIHVTDSPGFAVNRFFVPWLNESTRLLEENIANIPTIDDIAKKIFKIPMGPFELMNATGIPIAYHSTEGLAQKLGEFYLYSNQLKKQYEQQEPWDLTGDIDTSKKDIIEKRLLGAIFTVACFLEEEGVASIEDIDRGAKIGLRWRKGPFELMNKNGITKSYDIVQQFINKYPQLRMPTNLQQQYNNNEPWTFSFVDLTISNDVAHILINRPEAMNAINEHVIAQLDNQFTLAINNQQVKAIILEGAGKAFIAGADIQYFIKKIEQHKIDDIYKFTQYSHAVLNKIDNSKKPVFVKLDGLALGGGAEIALTADSIIASENGSIGFPETSIGIYPGLGGTQRTTHTIGKELAKYLIFTGKIVNAQTAATMGLVDHVVAADEMDNKITELINRGDLQKKLDKTQPKLPEKLQKIRKYFSDDYIQSILKGTDDLDELGQKLTKTISYKAPLAIKLSNEIIDQGNKLPLEKGLELELNHLKEIFSTHDALEGLKSVISRTRPKFTGK